MSRTHYIDYMRLDAFIDAFHPENPKGHDLGKIDVSYDTFGFVEPPAIDDLTGYVVAGHGRGEQLLNKMTRKESPPDGIDIDTDGMWKLPVIRGITFESPDHVRSYLIASNQLTIAGHWDEPELALLLTSLAQVDENLLEATGFDGDDLDQLLNDLDPSTGDGTNEGADSEGDSDLLKMIDVTIDDPKTIVSKGDAYLLDKKHYLICADVHDDVAFWLPHLTEEMIFAPYAGIFYPLSQKADEHTLFMVQPSPYIAGHILDYYKQVNGQDSVGKLIDD